MANIHTATGNDAGMLRIPAGVAAGAEVDIEAKWTTPSGTVQGAAKMAVAAPWATDPAMPKATIVDGHPDTWAGIIKPETVPNVLIFGDGFTSPDQPAFGSICNKLVHDLKRERTRGYIALADGGGGVGGSGVYFANFSVTRGDVADAAPEPARELPAGLVRTWYVIAAMSEADAFAAAESNRRRSVEWTSVEAETMWSPALHKVKIACAWAAWPELEASAATPPSRSARRCSRTSVVGFMMRV